MTKALHTSSLACPSALLTIQRDLAEDLEFRHMMCTVEPTVPAWPLGFVRWGLGLMHRSGPERSQMSLQAISSTAPKPLEDFCPSAVSATPFSLSYKRLLAALQGNNYCTTLDSDRWIPIESLFLLLHLKFWFDWVQPHLAALIMSEQYVCDEGKGSVQFRRRESAFD